MNNEILSYAYKIISKKDYTSVEIKNKIMTKFTLQDQDENLQNAIVKLKEMDLINDDRYKKIYIEQKLHNGYGPYYIVHNLYNKGIVITCKDVDEIASLCGINYYDIAKELLIKKIGNNKDIKKCYQFLERRGFYNNTISEVIKEVYKNGSVVL